MAIHPIVKELYAIYDKIEDEGHSIETDLEENNDPRMKIELRKIIIIRDHINAAINVAEKLKRP